MLIKLLVRIMVISVIEFQAPGFKLGRFLPKSGKEIRILFEKEYCRAEKIGLIFLDKLFHKLLI